MQGTPRGTNARAFIDEDEFDRDAEANTEQRVVNVSPFPARIEIATNPGTKPRRFKLMPGGSMFLQQGYCVPFMSVTQREVAAWIETHTEREAWPGVRMFDANNNKWVWKIPPGPRLPMVVHEDRADEFKERWARAMTDKAEAQTAPLRLTLQRQDGIPVDVEATVEPPVPLRRAAPPPPVDEEDQTAGGDEPPPDDNEPPPPEIPTVTIPAAANPTPAAERVPRGGGRGGAR